MASLLLAESRRITKHSPSTDVQRHTSHLEGQGAAWFSRSCSTPQALCHCYATEIRMKRVWCVLAMLTQACFDVGGIIGGIVRGMHAYNVCISIWGGCALVEKLRLLGVEAHQ